MMINRARAKMRGERMWVAVVVVMTTEHDDGLGSQVQSNSSIGS